MGTIDKAAIGWSIGIVLVAVGIAALGPASTPADTTQTAYVAPGDDAMISDAAMVDNMEETMMEETMMEETMMEETMADNMTAVSIVQISIPEGTGIPGCEADDACFDPFSVTVNAGDTVVWTNDDVVAHMVNAGSLIEDPTAVGFDYPNGFDSGLMMSDDTFEWTFEESGTYPYLCQLHPWMVGTITVN